MNETYDRNHRIHIRHEPDFSGTAEVSWNEGYPPHRATVNGAELINGALSLLSVMPTPVALLACALAAHAKGRYDADAELSRPSHRDDRGEPMIGPGFLFNPDFANCRGSHVMTEARRPVPLGWINNVVTRIVHNGHCVPKLGAPNALMFDFGAEPAVRDDHGYITFPRMARFWIPLAAVPEFAKGISRALEGEIVTFDPAVPRGEGQE